MKLRGGDWGGRFPRLFKASHDDGASLTAELSLAGPALRFPPRALPSGAGRRQGLGEGKQRPRRTHLQPHVEHHGGHDVEVGEVDAELPGQVEEDEQGPCQPLAEHAVGPGGGRLRQPGSQGGQSRRHKPCGRSSAPRSAPRRADPAASRPPPQPGAGCGATGKNNENQQAWRRHNRIT